LVESDKKLRTGLRDALLGQHFQVVASPNGADALEALPDHDPEVVLTNLTLCDIDGLELCRNVAERRPGVPVVVMSTTRSVESVIKAMRIGAYDFLDAPHPDVVTLALDRAIAHARLRREVRLMRRRARLATGLGALIGESPSMRRLFELIARVADTTSSVVITGESGTGKELVARELHRQSTRRDGPFVAVNCAAVPETLLESELFGHVKGAFTDARSTRSGLFLQANGGTLLLDEVGDMPMSVQPKLLRALQDRMIRPVGSDTELPVDVRVVASTHRNLDHLVEQGSFRGDLLYRLDVIRLAVPPLRARGNDVLVLAQRFLELYAQRFGREVTGFEPEAARKMLAYPWPGNVRELQNCMERAVVLAEHDQIVLDDLPGRIRRSQRAMPVLAEAADPAGLPSLDEVELRYVKQVVDAVGGNKAAAARILRIDRKTLHRKLQRAPEGRESPPGES
jgi:two-component system response regulator HydG